MLSAIRLSLLIVYINFILHEITLPKDIAILHQSAQDQATYCL